LHSTALSTRGASTSKRTAPQWQEPWWVVEVEVEFFAVVVAAPSAPSPAIVRLASEFSLAVI
jgi:hypothetical protein